MSVSNFVFETVPINPTFSTYPQFREAKQEQSFEGQNIIIQDNYESLVRASTFFKYLERNLNAPKGSKSPLQALLERSFHIPGSEENKSLFSEITHAFFKQKDYFSRLFSKESWEEWFDNRTALGKVASQLRNCIESRAEVCSFTKEMNPQLIQKANEETSVLLKGLGSRAVTKTSKGSCLYGLTSGIAASFLFENLLPLLMGLSGCFPRAYAQQKVGNEFQVNTYTNDNQWFPSVASFSNGNFIVTWESWDQDGSDDGVYGQLFNGNGSKIGNKFRANSYTTSSQADPSIASLANGNFVVTWHSQDQDGSLYGVYGQIFHDNITYPSNSTSTSSSTTSTSTTSSSTSSVSSTTSSTKTTSSMTSSVSSSTTSAIGRTRTSVNPSSSTTVPSTTRSITTSNNRATLSATSDPSNRFSWIWFLLGGVGAVSCLGLSGYFIFKSKDRKKDGDAIAFFSSGTLK